MPRYTVLRLARPDSDEDLIRIQGSGVWNPLETTGDDTTTFTTSQAGHGHTVDLPTNDRQIKVFYDVLEKPEVGDVVFLHFPNGNLTDVPYIFRRIGYHPTLDLTFYPPLT